MNVTRWWTQSPPVAKAGTVAVAAVVAVTGLAFCAGLSGSGDPAAAPPAAKATPTPSLTTKAAPPATHVSPKPVTPTTADDDGANVPSPTAQPDPIRDAAVTFVAAWLNTWPQTAESWRANLTEVDPFTRQPQWVTVELAATILDPAAPMDPETVPVGVMSPFVPPKVTLVADGIADVAILVVDQTMDRQHPTPLGTVTVTMVERGRRWLTSEIDWSPA